jgi:glycosyltransferase involved in cell wall biosynthesis
MERLSYGLLASFPDALKIVHETKPHQSLRKTRISSLLFALTVLPKAITASRHADIVHIGDPVLSFVGWCIQKIRHIPVVVTVHGLDITYTNPVYQLYLRLFFRSFDTYITISDYVQTLLTTHRVSGTITVIPPGVPDELFEPTKTRNELGKLLYRNIGSKVVFATTGRLVARKGHAWFIKEVLTHLPRTALYAIAGNGPEQDRIAALVRSLKLEDRVVLLGRISHEENKILLNTVDAFIQPNIKILGDTEGFGIAPVEAALCARPVFASNVDGIPTAIAHMNNGVLLPSKEATAWVRTLQTFMDHPLSHKPSGMSARAYTLEKFSWSTIAQEYIDVFQGLKK